MRNGDILIRQSKRAQCHPLEKELTVKSKNFNKAISMLKGKGMRIVGYSPEGYSSRKIWFINRAIAF